MNNLDFLDRLTAPFQNLAQRVLAKLPGILIAFVLLFLGLLAARGLRTFLERVLERAKLDEYAGSVGVNELLTRLGLGKSPSFAIGFVAYWFILLFFIVAAANAVELRIVSELLERFMGFLPALIAAILILLAGLVFARFLSEVVANASSANDIRGGELLSKATYIIIMGFSGLMALEQLGIQMLLVSQSIQIILASIGLAFALAFGLGAREIAADILRDLVGKKK